ncbi:flavin reductase family protein [Shouchella shacheensis]|uniref:flavin reductase family protein n=1 Tax=Shouchella shacheensis TaxID=1649580 RepID=UPI00074027F0|nr:flavin reductase family protein [Shouchella shacheensis]
MHTLFAQDLTAKQRYKLMTGAITPRPIAFVTTTSVDGTIVNAAPFSFFSMLSADPPLLSVSVGRREGEMKDTSRNAVHHQELVIHMVSESMVEGMNETAATLGPNESELKRTNFTLVESTSVGVPSIKEALVRFECTLESHLPMKGESGQDSFDLLIARVKSLHLAEDVYDEQQQYVLTEKLRPVARLAGANYASLGKFFSLERPK